MGHQEAPQTTDSIGSSPRCNTATPPQRCHSTPPQQSDPSASPSTAVYTKRTSSTPASPSASSATSPTAELQRAATLPQIVVEPVKQEPLEAHVDVVGEQGPSGSSIIRPAAEMPSSSSSSAHFQPLKTFLDFLNVPYDDAKPEVVQQQPKPGASAPTTLQFMPSPVGAAVSALRRRPSSGEVPPTLTPHTVGTPATPSPPTKRGKVDCHSIASMFQSTSSWSPSPSTSSDDVATTYEHFNPYAMNAAGMYAWSPPMGQFVPPLAAYDGSPGSHMGQATPSPSTSSQAYAHPPQVNISPYNANWTHASSSGRPSPSTPAKPTFMPLVEQRMYERCFEAARRERRIEETIEEVIAKVMAGWEPPYGEFEVPSKPSKRASVGQNDAQALAEALQQHHNTYRPLPPSQMSPQFGGLPGMPFFPHLQPMNMFHPQPPANFLSMLPPNFGQLPPTAFSQGLMQQTATPQLQQHALPKSEPASQEGTQYCRWSPCAKSFPSSHELYHHVLNEHFLRQRSQNEGLLACYWQQCPLKLQFFPVPEAHAHVKEHVPVPERVRPS